MNLSNLYFGVIIFLLLIFLYMLYESWKRDVKDVDDIYIVSFNKLQKDILIHGISERQFNAELRNNINNIVNSENKSSKFNKMLNACYSGILRGCIVGFVAGGASDAIAGSLIYGLISPIVLYVKEEYFFNEKLPA